MGKEEREKSRKLKGQSEVELDNQLRNEKLKAYDGVIKFLRANSLFEEKVIIGNQRFSIFNGSLQYLSYPSPSRYSPRISK